METNCISKRYATRSKARSEKPVAKSRVDWRRTRRSRLLESEEEDDDATSTSEKETSSEDDNEQEERGGESAACRSENEVGVNENILPGAELACDNSAAEDAEEENVALGKRKRSRCSVMYDSNESEDSDIVRKVYAKRSCIIDDEDSQVGQELCTSPAEEAASRKQKRCIKLQELSERQSTRRRSTSQLQEVCYEFICGTVAFTLSVHACTFALLRVAGSSYCLKELQNHALPFRLACYFLSPTWQSFLCLATAAALLATCLQVSESQQSQSGTSCLSFKVTFSLSRL